MGYMSPNPRVINLHITSYTQYPEPLSSLFHYLRRVLAPSKRWFLHPPSTNQLGHPHAAKAWQGPPMKGGGVVVFPIPR